MLSLALHPRSRDTRARHAALALLSTCLTAAQIAGVASLGNNALAIVEWANVSIMCAYLASYASAHLCAFSFGLALAEDAAVSSSCGSSTAVSSISGSALVHGGLALALGTLVITLAAAIHYGAALTRPPRLFPQLSPRRSAEAQRPHGPPAASAAREEEDSMVGSQVGSPLSARFDPRPPPLAPGNLPSNATIPFISDLWVYQPGNWISRWGVMHGAHKIAWVQYLLGASGAVPSRALCGLGIAALFELTLVRVMLRLVLLL